MQVVHILDQKSQTINYESGVDKNGNMQVKKVNQGIYLRKRLLRYRHPKGQRLIGRKKQTQEQESNLVNNQNQSQTKLGGTEYNAKIRRKKISLH